MESSRAKFDLTILIFVLAVTMLATANLWGVVETSEARYAEISREMFRSGDWLHPTLLKIHHYHKPPITYWITAVAYSVFGIDAFATRFFLIVAYCAQVVIVFNLAKMIFKNEMTSYYAAVIYATLPLVLISVRALTTDAYLNLFVLLSLFCWVKFVTTQKVSFFYILCLSLGLGFMTKGPVIFIVPLLAIAGTWNLLPRPQLNIFHVIAGLSIFIVVSFWWFVYLIKENSGFADYFFFHHLVDRVAHAEVFSRKEPWYYYLPVIPLVTIPWIAIFLKQTFALRTGQEVERIASRVLIWWFILPLVAFSIASSKLVLYILPLAVGFSLVAGHGATNFNKAQQLAHFILTSLVYVALILVPFVLPQIKIETAYIFIPGICLIISIVLRFMDLHLPRVMMISSLLFGCNLLLYSSLLFHFNNNEANTISPIANFIKQNDLNERQIVVYNELLPSLSFELDRDIVSVYAGNRTLKREVQFEQNTVWHTSLVDTTVKPGLDDLSNLLTNKSVIVTKTELPGELRAMMQGEWKKQMFGKWILYYN
jgi:4-amino-4-deoxy-L-arabinose transferase-like glycosyltransferase